MIPLIYAKVLLKLYYIHCDVDQMSLTMEEFEPLKPELDRHVSQNVALNKYKLHQCDTPISLSPLNCLIKYPKANFDEYKPKPVLVKTTVDKNDEYYRQEMLRKKKEKISKLKLIQYFNEVNTSSTQKIEKSCEKPNQMFIRLVSQKKPIQDYQTCDTDGSYIMRKEINPQNQILLNQVKGRVLPKTERRKFRQQETENIHNLSQLGKSKYQITKTQYDSPSNIGQIILKKGVKLIDFNQSMRPPTQGINEDNQSDIYQLQQQQKNLADFPQILTKLPSSTRSFHSVSPSPRSFRLYKNKIKF